MPVEYEKKGHVAVITMNRPEARNAINGEMAETMEAAIDQMESDPDVWVGILTAVGKAFCAGADLKEISAGNGAALSTKKGGFAGIARRERTKPLIAAITGSALAGGTEVALSCDMIICADDTNFGLPEVKVGVFPMQVLSLLQSIVPRRLVNEWALTGEPFDAQAALAAGLINHVAPAAELDAKVDWLVGRLTDKSPTAIRRGKYAMRAIASMSFDEAIAYTESQIALLAMTEDAKEGLKAFAEKRKPSWPGR